MKILIIEDEAELAGSIAAYLEGENYVCEVAASLMKLMIRLMSSITIAFCLTLCFPMVMDCDYWKS